MPRWYTLFFLAAIAFRLGTLRFSIRNERVLKKAGAVEFGRGNTLALTLVHTAFYAAALAEALLRRPRFDLLSFCGLCLYLFGAVMLVWIVRLLGRFWTVKLILASDHTLVTHALFRRIRHPNYYLAILPELVGLALALHAFVTLAVGLAVYAFPLARRIRLEDSAMRERFPTFGKAG